MVELWDLASTMRDDAMEAAAIEIDRIDHAATARRLARQLGVTVDELGLDGLYAAEEHLTVGTHFGTHLDAPTHYGDEIGGKPALSVDRMPLAPLFAAAVTLDFRDHGDVPIKASDLDAAFRRIGREPGAGEMVMTLTGIEVDYEDDPGIRRRGAGLDASGIAWLLERGVRLTATDSMTQDMPIPWMEDRFKAGDRDAYFPVHLAGKRQPYVHVEKANGLRRLPSPSGYRVAAFPVKVEGGSGAWARFHALRDLPFDPAEVEVVDLSQPIRRESMESEASIVRTHGSARRRRQWAKHLGVRTEEIESRGAWDQVIASTRAGTHVAAPWRFGPSCDGREARTIEDIPLDWCFGRALVLDVSDGSPDQRIDQAELVRALATTGRSVAAGDIVLLRTGAEDHWAGDPAYPSRGRGLDVAALEYLVERGVRVVGTDAESLDAPLDVMVAARELFPIHRAARRLEHVQVLKLGNLPALDRAADVWVDVAPIKVEAAGSGWTRAVAFVRPSAEHRPAVAGQAVQGGG